MPHRLRDSFRMIPNDNEVKYNPARKKALRILFIAATGIIAIIISLVGWLIYFPPKPVSPLVACDDNKDINIGISTDRPGFGIDQGRAVNIKVLTLS